MALRLDEFVYYSPQEGRAAEKLPLDSPERELMLALKLAELRAVNTQANTPVEMANK
jgi:hypothetical protein